MNRAKTRDKRLTPVADPPSGGVRNLPGFSHLNTCQVHTGGSNVFLVTSTDANSLWLAVANACRRLSEDQLDRPFDPFYRVEDVQETGTGLALVITRKIIE